MLRDVNSDQQQKGLETDVLIDRATASRMGINPTEIDNTLYDAFGQRQVSTIYSAQNQYHVIMEVAPRYWQSPQTAQRHLHQHDRRHRQRHADDKCGRRHRRPALRAVAASRASSSSTGEQQQRDDHCGQHRLQLLPQRRNQRVGQRPARAPLPRRRRSAPAWRRWFRWRRSPATVRATRRCP